MNKKFYSLLITILIIGILVWFRGISPIGITGFSVNNIQLNVSETLRGRITLSYTDIINFTQHQHILVEFTNTGSTTLTERIEVTIYVYSESKLQPIAHYYDSSVILQPGMVRSYENVFVAPYPGVFYIKAKALYDSKVEEIWGAFLVLYYLPPPTTTTIPPAPPTTVAPPPPPVEVGIPKMSLEYPDKVTIKQNASSMVSILVKNIGNKTLHNLKFYTSTSNLINVDVSPKQVFTLSPNKSAVFLLSIGIPESTPVDIYKINFEVVSDEITEGGSIMVNVTKVVSLKELVEETIQKYEYLIKEIEQEVYDAKTKGLNVDLAEQSLEKAKLNLSIAKMYYKVERYKGAMKKLKDVEDNLKDTVFQLATASIPVTVITVPAYRPIIILILAIIVALIFVIFFIVKRRRREKEERPKLLRELER